MVDIVVVATELLNKATRYGEHFDAHIRVFREESCNIVSHEDAQRESRRFSEHLFSDLRL